MPPIEQEMETKNAAEEELVQLEHSDRTRGTDELNLAEFPLVSLASRRERSQNTLAFQDEVFDKGNQRWVDRCLVVASSDHFGLPSAVDGDVLLVLVHLTNVRNGLKSKRVPFSRYELVKFMGWDHGGKSYRRLDESLQRWASITLHYKHAWWDCASKRWQVRSFHVLESLVLRGRGNTKDDGLSWFAWNDVIFDSFQAGNLKRLDLDLYFRLELAVSRRIYRFTDKRFYRRNTLRFDLRLFACEHVGLSRGYDAFDLKRKLQPAIEELEAIGYLVPLPVARRYTKLCPGKWEILLERAVQHRESTNAALPAIAGELTRRKISGCVAKSLAMSYPERHIAEKIELHDRLVERRDKKISKNAPGFLAAAIRNDYRPLEVANPALRELQHRPDNVGHNPSRHVSDDIASRGKWRNEAARRYWQRLSPSERDELQVRAVAAGERFQVQTYERLKKAGSKLSEALRDDLVARYLEQTGILHESKG